MSMPKVPSQFLVEYYNLTNGESTESTILQSWRSTVATEQGFTAKKKSMANNTDDVPTQATNELRLEYARSCHPKRWSLVPYVGYETAVSFYKWSRQVVPSVDIYGAEVDLSQQYSVWDQVSSWIQACGDLAHPSTSAANHGTLFVVVNMVFRILKREFPEFILPVVKLLFQRSSR